jgi:hypothetical protein
MRHPHIHAVLAGVLATVLAGCAGESPPDSMAGFHPDGAAQGNAELAAACGEARADLVNLAAVTSGSRRLVDATPSPAMIEQLAAASAAPPAVTGDLGRWRSALTEWNDALGAIPPAIAGGRIVEPDTSAIDARFIETMIPVGRRLGAWVKETCGPCDPLLRPAIEPVAGERIRDVCGE